MQGKIKPMYTDRARGNEVRKFKNNNENTYSKPGSYPPWSFGSLLPQTDQWEMTKFSPRDRNRGQFITLLHGKQGLEAASS